MPDTADRIVKIAQSLFVTKGYDATTMRDIADGLGLSLGASYHHFRSKEDVLAAVCGPLVDGFVAVARDVASARLPAETIISRYLDVLIEHRHLVQFVAGDAGALRHEAIGGPLRASAEAITDALAHAARLSRLQAACAMGALHGGVNAIGDEDDLAAVRAVVESAVLSLVRG